MFIFKKNKTMQRSYSILKEHTHTHTHTHTHAHRYIDVHFLFLSREIILWNELPWPENPANTCARHTETLDSCFDLIRSHQQCIPWPPPPLQKIESATTKSCDEGHWHAHTRGLQWGRPEVVGTVQQVHCSRRRLLRMGLEFHVCTINKSARTNAPFSIATTPMCRGGRYSFPWIAPLYPWYI